MRGTVDVDPYDQGKKFRGAYAMENEDGNKTLFIFEDEDDAVRYSEMNAMSDTKMPKLVPVEVEEEVA